MPQTVPNSPRVRALLDAIPPSESILDIGCVQHDATNAASDDWLHQYLYELGDDVLGIDYLDDEVAALREAGYSVETADAEALDLGNQFETVVAGELIEHLSNVGAFLDGVHDHLRPDGRFVLSTPNAWAVNHFLQAVTGPVNCNAEHTCWFDERTLRQVLARHGFAVDRVEYVRGPDPGLRRLLYALGVEVLGGVTLVVVARPSAE